MAKRLWEYRNAASSTDGRMAYSFDGTVFQKLTIAENGDLQQHIIEELESGENLSDFLQDLTDATALKLDSQFALLPKAFKATDLPGFENPQTFKLDDQVYLRFQGDAKSNHVIIPLYFIAKNRASGKSNYLLAYLVHQTCFLLYFKNGQCELANAYPVTNESELLYYCMAVTKKSGVDIRQVQFEILGNQTKEIIQSFRRFVANAHALQLELPYNTGEYPPYAAESYLLYQFLTCELPVDH